MQGYSVNIMKARRLQSAIVRRRDSNSLGPAGEPSVLCGGIPVELSRLEVWRLWVGREGYVEGMRLAVLV